MHYFECVVLTYLYLFLNLKPYESVRFTYLTKTHVLLFCSQCY